MTGFSLPPRVPLAPRRLLALPLSLVLLVPLLQAAFSYFRFRAFASEVRALPTHGTPTILALELLSNRYGLTLQPGSSTLFRRGSNLRLSVLVHGRTFYYGLFPLTHSRVVVVDLAVF
jgi:hypothetical protein